jgi:hypothetical protein
MSSTLRIFLLLALMGWSSAAFGDPQINRGVSGVVAPGSVLTLQVVGDKSHNVKLHAVNDPEKNFAPLAGDGASIASGLKVTLPSDLDPGPYYFTLVDNDAVIPGSVDVEPDKIKLISVHPATAYRGDTRKFDFDIVGEGFSINPNSDDVTIEGQGSIVKSRGAGQTACSGKEACLWVANDRLMHIVGYREEDHQGVVNVGIRVGNVTAADQKPLVLARFSGTVVFLLSAAVTAVLFWIVAFIVGSGLANKKAGSKRLTLLESFIFDPQTTSYSLSKLQLLLFSGTFIFGYLYVLLSRWLVQWQFSLPDVPSTIAGLLGISAGTTVASAGLTASRGAKGAGADGPSGADLISTGGVVVPERFQFFVWTIVACGGFIALLVGQDPSKVSNFPDLPSGLLYVMGVSAAGYLGGKAARSPGPILEVLGCKDLGDFGWAILTVQGQNLARDGRFFIDDKELGFPSDDERKQLADAERKSLTNADAGKLTDKLPDSSTEKLVTPTPQLGASDPDLSTQLEIKFVKSAFNGTTGVHKFRIINGDGQFAEKTFTVTPPPKLGTPDKGQPPAISVVPDKGQPPAISGVPDKSQPPAIPAAPDKGRPSAIPAAPDKGRPSAIPAAPGKDPPAGSDPKAKLP